MSNTENRDKQLVDVEEIFFPVIKITVSKEVGFLPLGTIVPYCSGTRNLQEVDKELEEQGWLRISLEKKEELKKVFPHLSEEEIKKCVTSFYANYIHQ